MPVARFGCDRFFVKAMSWPSSISELMQESTSLERNGDVATALQRAQEALTQARAGSEPNTIVIALLRVASVRYRLGQFDAARTLGEQALELATPNSPAGAHALIALGVYALETGSPAEAEQFLHHAADIGRENGDIRLRFMALVDLAAVYIPSGKFDLAFAADAEAYRLASEHNLQEQVYLPLVHKAQTDWLMGQREQMRMTLDELRKTCSPGSVPEGYRSLLCACLVQDEGDMQTAAALFTQARSVAETIGDPGLNCLLRIGLSRYHRALSNAAKAYEWANDAVALAERADCRRMWGARDDRACPRRVAEWQSRKRRSRFARRDPKPC